MTFDTSYAPEPKRPSGGPRKGTKALQGFILSKFDVSNLGLYNPRDIAGNLWPNWKKTGSQHARGAAGDCGLPVQRPEGHPEGHRLAEWLVDHHRALGVQEVIWAGRRWANKLGDIPWEKWPKYTGRSDHFDHVHWAQNDPGADGLTLEQILQVWNPTPPPSEEDPMYIVTSPYTGHRFGVLGDKLLYFHKEADFPPGWVAWPMDKDAFDRLVAVTGPAVGDT